MNGNSAEERNAIKLGIHNVNSRINGSIYNGALPGMEEGVKQELNNQNYEVASIPLEYEGSIRTSDDEGDSNSRAESPNNYVPKGYMAEKERNNGNNSSDSENGPNQQPPPPVHTGPLATITKTKTRYFSPRIKDQRKIVAKRWLMTVFFLGVFCFTILVLFWGALYRNPDYAKRAKLLAVIQEGTSYQYNETLIVPAVSAPLPLLIRRIPFTWTIMNSTEFQVVYNVTTPEEITNRINKLVYDEDFWAAINVQGNATETLVRSLIESDSSITFNSTSLFEIVYETARDLSNIPSVIIPPLQYIEAAFKTIYTQQYLPQLLSNVSTPENFNPQKMADAGRMDFLFHDLRPVTNRQYLIISQVGAVYCVLLTLFQFLLMGPVHQQVAKLVKFRHLWIYRIIMLWSILFFASLFYCTVSAIFHANFWKTFGRGGFMVYWMTIYLLMLSVGGLNENIVMLIILVSPAYIGFWVLSFVILNLAPTIFAIGFSSPFYRYGYAMPLYNAVNILRVIFFDISKRSLGRNYGILCAWIGLNTISMPFVSKFVMKTLHKRAKAAAAPAT
ncbi:Nitrosoguanidine resistance protein SNG1 [Nakaseomyces bracarensis]|uniref:Nitrosoguanidine resistance protein SNG1 n=1 Tax=Nakaseomyces bracarensis TaxID=273131 RepID=A0ABR4NQZ2_9SACH